MVLKSLHCEFAQTVVASRRNAKYTQFIYEPSLQVPFAIMGNRSSLQIQFAIIPECLNTVYFNQVREVTASLQKLSRESL
jgi:hypothetical protein